MLICEYFYFTKKLHKLCLIDICIRHYSTQQKAFHWPAHCALARTNLLGCEIGLRKKHEKIHFEIFEQLLLLIHQIEAYYFFLSRFIDKCAITCSM